MKNLLATAAVLVLSGTALAGGYSNGAIEHVKPMNLFNAGGEVSFAIKAGKEADKGFAVTDYYGNEIPATYDKSSGRLALGKLPAGYYEIANGGKKTSFGVVPFSNLSAADFRAQGRRFGLKVFQLGKPGVWWRKPWTWELEECVTACEKIGLQWTRNGFPGASDPSEPGVLSMRDIVTKHAMNGVLKIEGIPEEAYDENRYGPKDDFKKNHNKRGWGRCSVPLKEPYQKWLAEQINAMPADQNVFEIGNEVWDYMNPEEFVEWCRMVVPVVKRLRPGCVIGVDLSRLPWGQKVAAAGGLEGMNALYVHPYSFTPQPEVRIRAMLRNYRETCERWAGHKLDLYVTEYGWPTAPKDRRGHSTDERHQAQRTARESLMLYAEDCKTLIPHWMADREQDPTEREHWFGFFRLAGEPKPVVIAHAACARMIDGSSFVGDLALPGAEKGVGAMLFQRKGGWVVALWSLDEAPGAGRDVAVPAVPVGVYGLMGERRPIPPQTAGSVKVRVSGDVTYLVGRGEVPSALAKTVVKSGELSETRWFDRFDGDDVRHTVGRTPQPEKMGWGPKGIDAAPTFAAWHDGDFKVRMELPSEALVNGGGKAFIYFSTRPDRQPVMREWCSFDYELKVALKDGAFTVTLANPLLPAMLRPAPAGDPSGVTWTGEVRGETAAFEVAIPEKFLNGFGTSPYGHMAVQVSWATEKRSWKMQSRTTEDERGRWPLWNLER